MPIHHLLHHTQLDFVLLHRVLEPLLQHIVLSEPETFQLIREFLKVVQCRFAQLLLPFARPGGARSAAGLVCGQRGEVLFEDGLEGYDGGV